MKALGPPAHAGPSQWSIQCSGKPPPSGRPGRIPGLVGVGYLAKSPFQWSPGASTVSPPAVWRAHVRRIADASAHRPQRSMSRRASDLPTTLSELASIADSCTPLGAQASAPPVAAATSTGRRSQRLVISGGVAVLIAMPRRSHACAGAVAMVGFVVWLALSVWLHG